MDWGRGKLAPVSQDIGYRESWMIYNALCAPSALSVLRDSHGEALSFCTFLGAFLVVLPLSLHLNACSDRGLRARNHAAWCAYFGMITTLSTGTMALYYRFYPWPLLDTSGKARPSLRKQTGHERSAFLIAQRVIRIVQTTH